MKCLLFLLFTSVFVKAKVVPSQLQCAYHYNKVERVSIEQPDPNDIIDLDFDTSIDGQRTIIENPSDGSNRYEKCDPNNFCYTLWKTENIGNGTINITVMGQGCWASSDQKQDCDRSECISDKKPPKAMNTTKFCCCSGNFCNMNFTDLYVPELEEPDLPPSTQFLEQTRHDWQTVALVSVVFVFSFLTVVLVWHCAQRTGLLGDDKPGYDGDFHDNGPGFATGIYSYDHLKLCNIVGQGRYGSVWKGIVNEQDVAVKIFPAHHRNYFNNERDIYCLPFMDNPALLSYFGCDERTTMEGHTEYLLILSYAPSGCLQDYLRSNVLDWQSFCKMALSVAKGLAHLHTDIVKGDKIKPCVSHRDLNTRNILVKSDLSCCLCDMGFAMKISGSKYFHNGEEQHAETKSINEVGTLRYMAPEVLEGAVNLRDCESSLKQIDVYSMGLVLWELATRCTDLYPLGAEMPAYKLPFETEVGMHPTFEQMQTVVSRHKARPLWPEAWGGRWGGAPTHRLVRDTIEDCWDQDAEARLTALCVEERLHELPHLKDQNNRATIYSSSMMSPTMNMNHSVINNNNLNSSISPPGHNENTGNSISQPSYGKDGIDVSEGTVETIYTMSPSDPPNELTFKNSNQIAAYAYQQQQQTNLTPGTQISILQPFQGRNPCQERNLMIPGSSSEDLQSGNTLIDKSLKHTTHYRVNSETQGLLGHDYINQNTTGHYQNGGPIQNGGVSVIINRPATPIPYVQNVVYETYSTNSYAMIPKQINVPGNGTPQNVEPEKQKSGLFLWGGFKRLINKKFFKRDRLETALNEEPEVRSNLISNDDLQQTIKKMMTGPLDTQVNLIPGKTVNGFVKQNGCIVTSVLNGDVMLDVPDNGKVYKRPSSLPLYGVKQSSVQNLSPLDTSSSCSGHKILIHNELNPLSQQKFTAVPPIRNSSVDVDYVCNENTQLVPKVDEVRQNKTTSAGISQVVKRRKGLSRESSLEQFNEVFSSTSDLSRLKDPTQRIKTPGDVPPSVRRNRGRIGSTARFSLYDDRIMSAAEDQDQTWSCSVPDEIGVKQEDDEVIAVRADSVSSF